MSTTGKNTILLAPPAVVPGRRRRFTTAEKRAVLAEAMRPGTTFSEVARRYDIAVALLFRWRRQLTPEAADAGLRVAGEADAGPELARGEPGRPALPWTTLLRAEIYALRGELSELRSELRQLRFSQSLEGGASVPDAKPLAPRPASMLHRQG